MKNVNLLDKSLCTGCGLCNNVCPVNAIEMLPNSEGFIVPVINDSCIDCGLCAKKCPKLSSDFKLNDSSDCYAVWCEDHLRAKGGSGGVFPTIAEHTVKNGGIVFGAAFNEDFTELSHVGVDKLSDLKKLYKSKYVQSDAKKSYSEVKAHLNNGRSVVFCGCPCQVDALKAYLGKDYDNLITIDILCHGAPSPLAYNKFLEEVSVGKKVTGVDFRDKTYGWGKLIRVDFSDGTYHQDAWNGNYLRAFSNGMTLRDGCYHCSYAQEKRAGDLTIGDFWGVEKIRENWNDKKGTSLVMCNTVKGLDYLKSITPYIQRAEKIDYDKTIQIAKKANGALVRPIAPHKMHKCFFEHLKKGDSFSIALRYAEQSLMDVGILGWWLETPRSNYGSNLTAYALYSYVSSLGLSAAMISPPNFDRQNAGQFNKRYGYRMTAKYPPDKMSENNKYFDSYIVGSDVLWYYDAFIRQGYNFLLDFADDTTKRISYSTSFGNTVKFFPDEEMLYAKYLMQKFDHVSVRELEGVDICKERFDVSATQVLDPVFLCDMESWEAIAQNAERKITGDYVFAYILDPNKQKADAFKKLSKKLNCKMVSITDRQNNTQEREEILKNCGVLKNATIEEFVYHLMNAKFVIADSFHGFCFSLIFRRPFYAIANRTRGGSRFDTLAKVLDIKDRILESFDELNDKDTESILGIDYEKINSNIVRETERSKKWLNNALFSKKEKKIINENVVMGKELYFARKKISSLEASLSALESRIGKLEEK